MFEGLFQPIHLLILFFTAVLALIPAVFYLLTLRRALERCSVEARAASPESVWLMLIPVFNLVYQFIVVGNVAKSLRNEFVRRHIAQPNPAPGKSLGIAMSVLWVGSCIPLPGVPGVLEALLVLLALICWILYWVEIAGYSGIIATSFAPVQLPNPTE